jgi:hypothetical protein
MLLPIVVSVAAGLIAAGGAGDRPSILPTLHVVVVATPAVNRAFISETLAEAADIWRTAGVTIVWSVPGDPGVAPSDLTVTLDDRLRPSPDGNATLGWITFAGPGLPVPHIHLSRGNALDLMTRTSSVRDIPALWQEYLLSRALGRALAHELGHYLLKSPAHEAIGLMRAARPSSDFFSPSRAGFELTADSRERLARGLPCADFELMR